MRHAVRTFMLALLVAIGAAATATADDWTKTYTISGRPELSLITDDGGVEVVTWDRDAIGIHVITRGIRIGSSGLKITENQTGNRVHVEVRQPHFEFSFGFHSRSIRIQVSVPREADLDVQSGDGGVSVAPLRGTTRIHTGDGGISVEGLEGDVDLESGDGSIDARDLDGTLRVHTGDGTVNVRGRFDELVLRSGDGGVEAEALKGSRIRDEWDISTGDGHIDLRIPANLRANIDARTGDGRITVDLPLEVSGTFGRRSVRGSLNGGGPPLRLRSGDGPIHIERN